MKSPAMLIVMAALCLFVPVGLRAQMPATSPAQAIVPRLIKFSGTLLDEQGRVVKGPVGVAFALYSQQTGGAALWMETQNVKPDASGNYTVLLGANNPNGIPAELFTLGEARWLGVQVEGQAEQARVLLVSVPYALKAGDAQTLGGLPASAFAPANPGAPANSSSFSASPVLLTLPSSVSATTAPLTSSFLVMTPGGTGNFVSKFFGAFPSSQIENSQIFDNGTDVGIGFPATPTPTPVAKLDVNGTANIRGVLTLPATGTASTTATAGFKSQPLDAFASAFNSSTLLAVPQHFRWQAEPLGSNTSTPSGKFNLLYASGTGTPAETGLSISSRGVFTAPLGVLLYHASFQGTTQAVSGSGSKVSPSDGLVFLQSGTDLNSAVDLKSNTGDIFSFTSPDKPGSFLSLRLKAFSLPVTSDAAAYFLAGGDVSGTPARNGFGFKFVGAGDLNGVTILNGTETVVDLATTLGTFTTDPPVDLLAVRRAASVDFYVNGVLKGTATTNLPSSSDSLYELRLVNGPSAMQLQEWAVSYLTVGIPTAGAPPPGTF